VRLHHETHGSGPALLLTHGFGESTEMWAANIPALAGEHQVVAWDLRGHGRTDAPDDPEAYSHALALEDMATVLDAYDAGRAALCGMSLGGFLSLAFRLRHPERVTALVLVDTGPGYRRDDERDAWNAYVERTADGLTNAGHAHAARGIMRQHDAAVIESLPRIDVPTLVVVGSEDAPFLRAADYMAAKIPNARKLVIEGAGHNANMDAPDVFNAAVLEFLEVE
jgi:pimeloyl-ACP methyl ester carboxylesterase